MSVTPHPATFSAQTWSTAAAPLGETIKALSQCVTSAATDHGWRAHLSRLLDPVRHAFAEHRTVTEGATGLYAALVHDAPRLANTVTGLVAEHHALDAAMAQLATVAEEADSESLRLQAVEILTDLGRHRQHDADLVYEAYATDIGGE
jgi:Hemerythrin HHE cation binding domain